MRLHRSRNKQFAACERVPRNTVDTYRGSKDKCYRTMRKLKVVMRLLWVTCGYWRRGCLMQNNYRQWSLAVLWKKKSNLAQNNNNYSAALWNYVCKNVLTVMIIHCKIYFVFFIFNFTQTTKISLQYKFPDLLYIICTLV